MFLHLLGLLSDTLVNYLQVAPNPRDASLGDCEISTIVLTNVNDESCSQNIKRTGIYLTMPGVTFSHLYINQIHSECRKGFIAAEGADGMGSESIFARRPG